MSFSANINLVFLTPYFCYNLFAVAYLPIIHNFAFCAFFRYSSCSADCDAESEITCEFFATVQNILHYAITGETAEEIIKNRANSEMPNMGLTSWKNAPDGKIRKTDVSIAKSYWDEKELDLFNRIVTMYLDYAELQAFEHRVLYMSDWLARFREVGFRSIFGLRKSGDPEREGVTNRSA